MSDSLRSNEIAVNVVYRLKVGETGFPESRGSNTSYEHAKKIEKRNNRPSGHFQKLVTWNIWPRNAIIIGRIKNCFEVSQLETRNERNHGRNYTWHVYVIFVDQFGGTNTGCVKCYKNECKIHFHVKVNSVFSVFTPRIQLLLGRGKYELSTFNT